MDGAAAGKVIVRQRRKGRSLGPASERGLPVEGQLGLVDRFEEAGEGVLEDAQVWNLIGNAVVVEEGGERSAM